jgi:hypothetical protein
MGRTTGNPPTLTHLLCFIESGQNFAHLTGHFVCFVIHAMQFLNDPNSLAAAGRFSLFISNSSAEDFRWLSGVTYTLRTITNHIFVSLLHF